MVADQTIGVPSANGRRVARIRASIVDASGRIGAVEVGEAVPWLLATRLERISDQSVGTHAGVGAFRVLTTVNKTTVFELPLKLKRNVPLNRCITIINSHRGRVARIFQTLVDVLADIACQLEAWITFAYSSVVGRYAVAVSAIHLIARTLDKSVSLYKY